MGFWSGVGHGFAAVAKGAAKGAIWASKNPAVIAQIATIAGHPEVAAAIAGASAFAPKPAAPTPVEPPVVAPVAPVVPAIDPLASIRQFVIDTYCAPAPMGLNRANVAAISPVELQDGIEKVQKHGTHGLQREMYTRNGIHDDQMPPELLIDNPI